MQRIFRGVLRFSCGGFTNLRIARKFSASAPRSTSAQTGRLASLRGLFCVRAMTLPKKLVYAIQPPRADSHFGCRENDNPLAVQLRGLRNRGDDLSKATPGFLVSVADKGLTAPVSYLESTFARMVRKR